MKFKKHILALLFFCSAALSAQHKWDRDSIYLAEFASDTLVLPDTQPFAVQVSPLRALYGAVGADLEGQLTQNKSILFGINHVSAFYSYGQPNDPEKSLLLNHYGNYIYEEWIFENVLVFDFRHYWVKKKSSGAQKTRYIALLNRFYQTRWDYSEEIIANPYYTSGDDELWNGASPWIPMDMDDLTPRFEFGHRLGVSYGRRRRLPASSFFTFREFAVGGILRYDRWREQALLIPHLKWTLVY